MQSENCPYATKDKREELRGGQYYIKWNLRCGYKNCPVKGQGSARFKTIEEVRTVADLMMGVEIGTVCRRKVEKQDRQKRR